MGLPTIAAGLLVLIVGAPQRGGVAPDFSIVGEWARVGKPQATIRYGADGKWRMHVVGVRGLTADMSGTYKLRNGLLERTTLKTLFSRKRPYLKTEPTFREYDLKWLSKSRITLTDRGGPRNWERIPDTWVRRPAGASE